MNNAAIKYKSLNFTGNIYNVKLHFANTLIGSVIYFLNVNTKILHKISLLYNIKQKFYR